MRRLAIAFVVVSGLLAIAAAPTVSSPVAGDRAAPAPAQAAPPATSDTRPCVLITGANRGLGLEFARQYTEAGWVVIGTARRPDAATDLAETGAQVIALDVTDPASVAALVETLDGRSIDLLINNAGVSSRSGAVDALDFERAAMAIDVNLVGPMRVTSALLPNLRAGTGRRIVGISSGLGSIERNTSGGFYGYRESKAGLNMFTRSIAANLRAEGFTCVVLSPGWVRTDMGGAQAPLSPEQSIRGMRTVIDALTPERTGRFLDYDGTPIPW